MMSLSTIKDIQAHAAYEAAQEGMVPLVVEYPEDARGIPFLGEYVPAGWRIATWVEMTGIPRNVYQASDDDEVILFVDKSGFGSASEPALTLDELTSYMARNPGLGWAIYDEGQFQLNVRAYIEDPSAPGVEAPEPDPCEECGSVHPDIDECDQYCVRHQAEHYPWDCPEDRTQSGGQP